MQKQAAAIKAEKNRREAARLKSRLFYFVQEFWSVIIPETPVWNWHIEYLCDEVQKVYMRAIDRLPKEYDLVINVPPGSTKSTICSVMVQAWAWAVDPTLRLITGSYSEALSTEHAMASRNIIMSPKYQELFPHVVLKRDENNKTNYKTVKNGQRVAASVGGTITGIHAHIINIDDPLNVEQSYSAVERKKSVRWIEHTISQRKISKAITATILIMQRLHEDDPSGVRLKKLKLATKHISLPAELSDNIQPPELKEKYVDGLLDPVRISRSVIEEQKELLGSSGYAGQYAQRPAPDEGLIFQKAWFKVITWSEFNKIAESQEFVWKFRIDGAFTSDKKNDPTGILAYCIMGNNLYVRNFGRNWLEFHDACRWVKEFVQANGYDEDASDIKVEPKASGLPMIHSLREETNLNISAFAFPKNSKVSMQDAKEVRAKSIAPKTEAGRVILIDGGYVNDFVESLKNFPNASHDEEVDCLVMAVQELLQPKIEIDII